MASNTQHPEDTLARDLVEMVSSGGVNAFKDADQPVKRASTALLMQGIQHDERLTNWGHSSRPIGAEVMVDDLMSQYARTTPGAGIGGDWASTAMAMFRWAAPRFGTFDLSEAIAMEIIALRRRRQGLPMAGLKPKKRSQRGAIGHFGTEILSRELAKDTPALDEDFGLESLEQVLELWSEESSGTQGASPTARNAGRRSLPLLASTRRGRRSAFGAGGQSKWEQPDSLARIIQHDPLVQAILSKEAGGQDPTQPIEDTLVQVIATHPLVNQRGDSLKATAEIAPLFEPAIARILPPALMTHLRNQIETGIPGSTGKIASGNAGAIGRHIPSLRSLQFANTILGDSDAGTSRYEEGNPLAPLLALAESSGGTSSQLLRNVMSRDAGGLNTSIAGRLATLRRVASLSGNKAITMPAMAHLFLKKSPEGATDETFLGIEETFASLDASGPLEQTLVAGVLSDMSGDTGGDLTQRLMGFSGTGPGAESPGFTIVQKLMAMARNEGSPSMASAPGGAFASLQANPADSAAPNKSPTITRMMAETLLSLQPSSTNFPSISGAGDIPAAAGLPLAAQSAIRAQTMTREILGGLGYSPMPAPGITSGAFGGQQTLANLGAALIASAGSETPPTSALSAFAAGAEWGGGVFANVSSTNMPASIESGGSAVARIMGSPAFLSPATPAWAKGTGRATTAWDQTVQKLGYMTPLSIPEVLNITASGGIPAAIPPQSATGAAGTLAGFPEQGAVQTGTPPLFQRNTALSTGLLASASVPGAGFALTPVPSFTPGVGKSLQMTQQVLVAPWQTATAIGALSSSQGLTAGPGQAIRSESITAAINPASIFAGATSQGVQAASMSPGSAGGIQESPASGLFPGLVTPALSVLQRKNMPLGSATEGQPRWRIGPSGTTQMTPSTSETWAAQHMTQIQGTRPPASTEVIRSIQGILPASQSVSGGTEAGLGIPAGLVPRLSEPPTATAGSPTVMADGTPLATIQLQPQAIPASAGPAGLFEPHDGAKSQSLFMSPDAPFMVEVSPPGPTSSGVPALASSARSALAFGESIPPSSGESPATAMAVPPMTRDSTVLFTEAQASGAPVIRLTSMAHGQNPSSRVEPAQVTWVAPGSATRAQTGSAQTGASGSYSALPRLLKRLEPGMGLWNAGGRRAGTTLMAGVPGAQGAVAGISEPIRRTKSTTTGAIVWTGLNASTPSPGTQAPGHSGVQVADGPPGASFSRYLLRQKEQGLEAVGTRRILTEMGGPDQVPGAESTMLGSDSLDYVLGIPATGEKTTNKERPFAAKGLDRETEWVHPATVKESPDNLQRVLVQSGQPTDSSEVTRGATPSFDPQALRQMKPRVTAGSMGSAVAQSAMLSEDSPSEAPAPAKDGGKARNEGQQSIDLDALATELAGRIKARMQRMNERTGRWS